jgi:hypothetical protein
MGCELFDLGIMSDAMTLRERQRVVEIEKVTRWLRCENARGAHVYIRPSGRHSLSLLDEVTAEAIIRMKVEGFELAVVVETSPNNFQVWLNHGQVLESAKSTRVAKLLAERFEGDPSSADWRHFGRLAGFTNPKPERRLPSGLQPFVRLRSAGGCVYSRAPEFLAGIRRTENRAPIEREAARKQHRRPEEVRIRTLKEFQADPRYSGDLHRADMAWALHAAGRGIQEHQIEAEILNECDLSKKGGPKRQLDYARRTANKAVASVSIEHARPVASTAGTLFQEGARHPALAEPR